MSLDPPDDVSCVIEKIFSLNPKERSLFIVMLLLWFRRIRRQILPTVHLGSRTKMEETKIKNANVFLLGLAFMLVFTAFQTMGNVEKTILDSAKTNGSGGYVPGFSGSGYASLAIIYTAFAASNWMAPSAVALLGPRPAMAIGGAVYAGFIAQFWQPNDVALYGLSAILGLGAAIIWTAQGNFLTINSDPETMSRNSGIFWAMLQSSMLIGNTFIFFQFSGLKSIDEGTRHTVTIVLFTICCAGVLVLCLLRPTPWTQRNEESGPISPGRALKDAWNLFMTRTMWLLSVTFFYSGLELTFWSGVYGSCIGFTKSFGDHAKSLVGVHGIVLGVGEIIGGLLFGILGHTMSNRGRDPIVILGFLVHMISFFLIFINLPSDSPFGDTSSPAYLVPSNAFLALTCSFLLGFGDACFNTQIFSILGCVFADNSAAAFAIFKFVQSSAAALAFFYSDLVPLNYQLLVLSVFCLFGTLTFTKVEWRARARQEELQRQAQIQDAPAPQVVADPESDAPLISEEE